MSIISEMMTAAAKAVNKNFAFMEFPLSMSRQGDFPLDKSSLWWDLEAATNYAKSNPTAYPGQPLTVVNEAENSVAFYLVGTNGELVPQGAASSVEALKQELTAHKVEYNSLKTAYEATKGEVTQLKSDHTALSGKHDALESKHNTLQSAHDALDKEEKQLKKDFDALKDQYDSHTHTADEITETGTRVFVTPAQKGIIDTVVYATNSDIDDLFPELKPKP